MIKKIQCHATLLNLTKNSPKVDKKPKFTKEPLVLPMYYKLFEQERIPVMGNPMLQAQFLAKQEELEREKKADFERKEAEQKAKLLKQKQEEERALSLKRAAFEKTFEKYKTLALGFGEFQRFSNWQNCSLERLLELESALNSEIERARMIQDLKQVLVRGANFYLPDSDNNSLKDVSILEDIILLPIQEGNSSSYRKELARISNIYLKNSQNLENPILTLNETVKTFFIDAGKKIKEIFALKEEEPNKWLEKIPKLGLIAKSLRVTEQIYLANCIMDDYKAVSDECFKEGISVLLKKYDTQYKTIQSFINQNIGKLKDEDKKFTEHYLAKINEAKEKRILYYNKVLKNYTNGGFNINNICKNIKLRGSIELATKTVLTFLPLF